MAFCKLEVGRQYLYRWDRMNRKGDICTLLVIARRMDSVAVQFADGHTAITSGKALAPIPRGYVPPARLLF